MLGYILSFCAGMFVATLIWHKEYHPLVIKMRDEILELKRKLENEK